MTLLLRTVSHSEIGLVRKNNQDSGYASPHLLVVADGMGGAAAGDLASAVAVDAIRHVDALTPAEEMLPVLTGAFAAANDRIAELVHADASLEGMGTTVTGALFDGAELGLAHIGDSRAYLFRDGRLQRLTHDHSWVQSLVDEGRIDESEAAAHPHRSLLLKVLNGQPANDPDLSRVPLQAGDRLLLCSDGLCGLVDDEVLARTLGSGDLASVLAGLVEEAHAGGGIDNITVILADLVEGEPVLAGDTVEVAVLGAAAERMLPGLDATGAVAEDTDDDELEQDGHERDGSAQGPVASAGGGSSAAGSDGAEDEARYNPQPPRQRRGVKSLAGALVLLLVVVAAFGTAYAWGRTQYYVGAAGAQVAIYQGLPEMVVVPLSRVFEVQPLALAALPVYYQDQVRAGIEVSGLESARQTVVQLVETAARCARPGATPPGTTPSPGTSSRTPTPRTPSGTTTPAAPASSTGTTPAPSRSIATTSASAVPTASATGSAGLEPGC